VAKIRVDAKEFAAHVGARIDDADDIPARWSRARRRPCGSRLRAGSVTASRIVQLDADQSVDALAGSSRACNVSPLLRWASAASELLGLSGRGPLHEYLSSMFFRAAGPHCASAAAPLDGG